MACRNRRITAVVAFGMLAAGCGTTVSGSEAARNASFATTGDSLSVRGWHGGSTKNNYRRYFDDCQCLHYYGPASHAALAPRGEGHVGGSVDLPRGQPP
jgi:hypothetical protein